MNQTSPNHNAQDSGNELHVDKTLKDSAHPQHLEQDNRPHKTVLQDLREANIDRRIEIGIAFAGLLVAITLACVAYGQLKAMQDQATSIKAQLDEIKAGSIETQKLVAATEKIAEATRESMAQSKAALDATIHVSRTAQRAYVTHKKIEIEVLPATSGNQAQVWQFRAIWENIGNTPTRDARSHVNFLSIPTPLPKDFKFPDLGSPDHVLLTLGPQSTIGSSILGVDARIIKDVQDHKMHLYFWGWMTYHDILGSNILHVTKFCRELTEIHGDPLQPTARKKLLYNVCPYHNCIDDECLRKPKT